MGTNIRTRFTGRHGDGSASSPLNHRDIESALGRLAAYDDDRPVKHLMETGSPHASYAIVENAGGAWNVTLRRVTYDWAAAARQAELAGRDDWARGLATGRMRE